MNANRSWRLVVAAALMVGLPSAAYVAAPAQAGSPPAPPAVPALDLAGFNASAQGAGLQFQLLVPGLVPLGDPTKGNFIQASAPYSSSTSSTGPTNGSVTSPVWPGDAVATAGNAVQTFAPTIPVALVHLLNYPVLARSAYPTQVGIGATGSFSPTGPAGIGTSTTKSDVAGSTGMASITDLSPLGASKAGIPLIDVASASVKSSTTVGAASVSDSAETHLGRITIAGVITIDGLDSTATASSDGKSAGSDGFTNIGAVKVAGLAASIGPHGITLNGKDGQAGTGLLIKTANQLLASLQKLGISITTVAPQKDKKGNVAFATSGAVLVSFKDDNLPDLGKIAPQLPIPLPNSLGIEVSLGLSQATAAATRLPADEIPPTTSIPTTGPSSGTGVTTPGDSGSVPPLGDGTTSAPPITAPVIAASPEAVVFGVPIRTAWVVISMLIALLAAGPLLSYANWQLLRGRTP